MREIKFRAWDTLNDKWLNLWKIVFNEKVMAIEDLEGEMYGMHQIKLMQYTGLKDVNGVEIYEGDILENKLGIGYVEYKDNGLWLKLISPVDEDDGKFHWDFSMENSKVLGNKFENPELLNNEE